ncbi:MAG: phosphate signaling complex protein PhoU [Hydrogenovibrio sp.]
MEKHEFSSHISENLNRNLEDLFNHILEMGGLVERQFETALVALGSGDVDKATEVVLFDRVINKAEMEIDSLCAKVLARQQPTASDLRLILAAIRIAIDLERMGDEIVKIGNMVITFGKEHEAKCAELSGYIELVDISTRSNGMLKMALDSFARVSTENAGKIIQEEELIDEIFAKAMQDLKQALVEQPDQVECLMEMIIALRAAERVSDHARNVVESIIYLVKGQDMRNMDSDRLNAFLETLES